MSERLVVARHFQMPNFFIDELMPLLSPAENTCLLYVCRRTLGFHKVSDRISMRQIAEGLKIKGRYVDGGTGISINTVEKAVKELIGYGVVVQVSPNDSKKNEGPELELQLDADLILWASLQNRVNNSESRRGRYHGRPSPMTGEGPTPMTGEGPTPMTGEGPSPMTGEGLGGKGGTPPEIQKEKQIERKSASDQVIPETMPDGTKRLSADQLAFVEKLTNHCRAHTINPQTLAEFRKLFSSGLTVPAAETWLEDFLATKETNWRTGAPSYFATALRNHLDTLKDEQPHLSANGNGGTPRAVDVVPWTVPLRSQETEALCTALAKIERRQWTEEQERSHERLSAISKERVRFIRKELEQVVGTH